MFSADGDGVDDILPGGTTDGSDDVQMEGNIPKMDFWEFLSSSTLGYFHHGFS